MAEVSRGVVLRGGKLVKKHLMAVDDPANGSKCVLCREIITQGSLQPNEYPMGSTAGHCHLACLDWCTRRGIQADGSVRVPRQDVIWAWKANGYVEIK